MRRPASVTLFLLLAAAALGASSPVLAEDLSPALFQKLSQRVREAGGFYQKREYKKAIQVYEEVLSLLPAGQEMEPNRMRVHYSIASSHALLGNGEEALGHLEKAVEHGLTEMQELDRNDDFGSLRQSPRYAALPARMKKREEEARRRTLEKLGKFDFSTTDLEGKPVQKKDFLGQVLIVDIWGTWCPPCRAEIPHLIELEKRYRAQGLRIVGLNFEKTPDSREAARVVKKFVEDYRVPYPCAIGSQDLLEKVPGFQGFPTTIFFGRDGSARAMEVGARDLKALEAIVKPLLAEAAPPAAGPGAGAEGAPQGSRNQ